MARIGPGAPPLYARIPEKRFWKAGKRHRVRSLEFIAVGAQGRQLLGVPLYSLRAFTQCGESIPFAEISEDDGGQPCKRCER